MASNPSTWKALSTLEWKKVRMHNNTLMPAPGSMGCAGLLPPSQHSSRCSK